MMMSKPPSSSSKGTASISKCAAISAALAWVRLAMTMRAERHAFNTGMTPRTAPPAPSSKTVLPDISTPSLFEISSVSPSPSVLSPRILPFSSKISVLTAPAAKARSECSSDKANASCLNGTVTFAPLPPSAKNASTACAKPPMSAQMRSYSISTPSCKANCRWICGDLLCATGLPKTA